jgi:predicted amidohydrolase
VQALTLSLFQCATRWHDPAANRALFEGLFKEASSESDVLVLPEMFSTGFTMASQEVAEPMDGPTVNWMRERAAERDQIVCGSVVIEDQDAYFNRFIWARPDGSIAHYDKRHLFRMADEHRHYREGDAREVLELDGWRILPLVCYDLRFPVWSRNAEDYDVLLCVANWPAARRVAWQTLLKARAIENLSYSVGVNRIGVDGNQVSYAGDSAVYDFAGGALIELGDEQQVATVSLDPTTLRDHREAFPAWRDADQFEINQESSA